MKLDPKCTIAVLTAIEEAASCTGSFVYVAGGPKPEVLDKYTPEEIIYHIHQCNLSGYLIGCNITGHGAMVFVEDLDPKGHEALTRSRTGNFGTVAKDASIETVKELGKGGLIGLAKWLFALIKSLITPV